MFGSVLELVFFFKTYETVQRNVSQAKSSSHESSSYYIGFALLMKMKIITLFIPLPVLTFWTTM